MRQYLDLLQDVLNNGVEHNDRTGVGTLSVFGRQVRYKLDQKAFPILTTKRVAFRWIAEELFWFLSGSTNEKGLREKGIKIWREWATAEQVAKFGRKEGDLGPVYGYLWRSFGGDYPTMNGVDQIKRLIDMIQNNPNSRRLLVTGWDPAQCDNVALPPCHTVFQFKVESEKILHCQLYMRSADLFLGIPFNISSYCLLTMLIAHVCDLEPGEFVHTFGDAHIYKNHVEQVKTQLSRTPKELPTLVINEDYRGSGLDGLISMGYDDLKLMYYNPDPKIEAKVAI